MVVKVECIDRRKAIRVVAGGFFLLGAAFLAKSAVADYYASRWLDAVIKELGRAKRKLELDRQQNILWDEGEKEFRLLLEAMRGRRDRLRAMYERAALDAEAGKDYGWLHGEISQHWHDMMESHRKVVLRWHAFDRSLTAEHRRTFRASMRELVVKDWEHFSGRWNGYLVQQAQLTRSISEQILRNPTPADKELGERTFTNMKAVTDSYAMRRKQITRAVDRIMSDPGLPLTEINLCAEENWNAFEASMREVYAMSRYYYHNNSMARLFKENSGKLAAAAFRKQRETIPPSYNN